MSSLPALLEIDSGSRLLRRPQEIFTPADACFRLWHELRGKSSGRFVSLKETK